jgi:hypothetical protein
MKRLLLVITCFALGSLAGWIANGFRSQAEGKAADNISPSNSDENPTRRGNAAEQGVVDAAKSDTAAQSVADLVEKATRAATQANEKLAPAEFGAKLASLLIDSNSTAARVEADAMKGIMTPDRLVEFYKAYSKRVRLADDSFHMNPVLTDMGQKYGKKAYEAMLAQYPDGFQRMDSLIHGWAMSDPTTAVAWFNDLPETNELYNKSLQGLIWGLTTKDGPQAAKVIENLSAEDRNKAMFGFASAFVTTHGLNAFDSWLATASPELSRPALAQAVQFAVSRPLEEYVPWFVTHADKIGMRPELAIGFNQWYASAPDDAMGWFSNLPEENKAVQTRLLMSIKPEAKQHFLSKHPEHPGNALSQKNP